MGLLRILFGIKHIALSKFPIIEALSNNIVKTAKHVIKQRLNVRQTERLVSRATGVPTGKGVKSADTRSLEAELSLSLGCKVTVSGDAEMGDVRIAYRDLSLLDRIIRKLRS